MVWGGGTLGKCFPCKCENLSSVPQNFCLKTKVGVLVPLILD